jgi:hypothetical protein
MELAIFRLPAPPTRIIASTHGKIPKNVSNKNGRRRIFEIPAKYET